MKTYLKILSVFIVLMSCQENKEKDSKMIADNPFENTSLKNNVKTSKKQNEPKTTLTKEQFIAFFPEQIGAYKLKDVSVLMSNTLASALYLKDNDFNQNMTYSLEDGNRKSSAVNENFEVSYKFKNQGPPNTEYIYQERDGYKTIAFLQPTIKRNEISFVYNNRFRLTMEGKDPADALWSYFDVKNLDRLDLHK